jgi:hypothetical protein
MAFRRSKRNCRPLLRLPDGGVSEHIGKSSVSAHRLYENEIFSGSSALDAGLMCWSFVDLDKLSAY